MGYLWECLDLQVFSCTNCASVYDNTPKNTLGKDQWVKIRTFMGMRSAMTISIEGKCQDMLVTDQLVTIKLVKTMLKQGHNS